jgi:hypothetical protein
VTLPTSNRLAETAELAAEHRPLGAILSTEESTLIQEQVSNVEPGDHERFSHYVRKEKIVESAVMGIPVIALCGKVWVPGRDPEKFPVCSTCKEIYEGLKPEADRDRADRSGSSGEGAS